MRANCLAPESELFIFVDGPRQAYSEDTKNVEQTREIAESVAGFKSVTNIFSKTNKGLAESIIKGVSQIISQYGKVIVLEDDLIVSLNFLDFMNEGLDRYEHEQRIFSICGYTSSIKTPKSYPYDAYVCTRSSSWGWGTWRDRWETVDWNLQDWIRCKKMRRAFNRWGGSDCFDMLRSVKEGKGKSWAIRFCFTQFLHYKVSIFPVISKVKNEGFDGHGTNCKGWSRFRSVFDCGEKRQFVFPEKITINKTIYKSVMSYNHLFIRIFSRIMYIRSIVK